MSIRRTASILVIGDEVLSAKVEEQNARFALPRLAQLGVQVREVRFIPDHIETIVEAVRSACRNSDVVITSGGVGPTHDDLTALAVAQALGKPCIEHPDILALLERVRPLTSASRRLARSPEGAEIMRTPKVLWPVLRCKAEGAEVWLFPGVPSLFAPLFEGLANHFQSIAPRRVFRLELETDESSICERLDQLVARHATVSIGSYPRREASQWVLQLTFECEDEQASQAAYDEACECFAAYRCSP